MSIVPMIALSYQPGVKFIPQLPVDSVNKFLSLTVNETVKL